MYPPDLVHYSKDNVKVDVKELADPLTIRMEKGKTKIPSALIQNAILIVHQVSTNFQEESRTRFCRICRNSHNQQFVETWVSNSMPANVPAF